MNKNAYIVFFIIFLAIGAIILIGTNSAKDQDFLSRYNLDDMSVKEIVSHLENKLDEPEQFNAGITGTTLILSDLKEQIELALPNGLFYLSFAPYINQTHPCANHNLVTCRGEMKNQSFQIQVVDSMTNEIIMDEMLTTKSNGFSGIWLPKDRNFQLTVTYGTLSATTQVSTSSVSNTCLTTLKLS